MKKSSSFRKNPSLKKSSNVLKISERDMELAYGAWDQLDQFSPGEKDGDLKLLCTRLKKLLRADNVKWIAAVRVLKGKNAREDRLKGWRLRASYSLVPDTKTYEKFIAVMYRQSNRLDPDFQIGLATHAIIAGAGKFQSHRLRDGWILFREFSRSEHYRLHYTELGISDRMWFSFPLNADTESVFLIDRTKSKIRFSKRDELLAATILRGIRGFHRRAFLNHGLVIGDIPLSSVFQRIVQKLLTGMSEKEIAASMDQSLSTTHKYIQTIYQRFGVNGRAALMSLWVGAR